MKIPTAIKSFLTLPPPAPRMDPVRNWLVLITVWGIVFAGIIAWNVWAFNIVASGGVLGKTPVTVSPPFNQSALSTVHSLFESRSNEEAKYVSGFYTYTDPSL